MGFLGVYKAVYDYVPQGESELAISEGDILYVLEKSGEDDWWRAKKKASGDDDDEPVGLIPNNYVEEVRACLVSACCCWIIYLPVAYCGISTASLMRYLTPEDPRKRNLKNVDAD
jgi:hypothetical protein